MVDANTTISSNNANLIQSSLTTDFNITPYYDDYTPANEYYRILFKPGYSVQARELTQIQSMLQSQIKRFGINIFKEGSIVVPGQFTFRTNVNDKKASPINYVKIKTNNYANTSVNVASFLNQTITGANSGIRAHVTNILDTDGTQANTKTLYVTYLGTSPANSQIRTFSANEKLINSDVGYCIVEDSNNSPIGYASAFRIDEGVLFAKDHFIYFPTQEIILDRYNPSPTCRTGFILYEDVVNASQDSSLLDPALEASNYSAPGADRLRITATLSVQELDYYSSDFVTLFTMNEGTLSISNDKSQYNIIGDTMAARTYDEAGDYVIRGYNVQISEHDKVTYPVPNNGKYANGNSELLIVSVDAGHGYVKGYAVTNYDKSDVIIEKAMTYANNVDPQILSTTMGSYVTVNELVGSWQADQGTTVYFYNVPNQRVTGGGSSYNIRGSGTPTGTQIGYGSFMALEYVSDTPGFDAKYNIYLTDIQMNSGYAFNQVRSLYIDNDRTADCGADIIVSTTKGAVLQNIQNSPLLFYTGSNAVRSLRNLDGTPSVDYYYKKTDGFASAISIAQAGTLFVTLNGPTNETLPYGTTILSDSEVRSDIALTCGESFNIGPLWTSATVVGTGTSLTGAGTHFTYLNVGDRLEITGISNTFYISSITDDNHLTLSLPLPSTGGNSWITGNNIFKSYKTGDNIDLTGVGLTAGNQRTVSVTPTSISIDLKETLPRDIAATLTYKLYVANSNEVVKTLKPHRFVKIDCSTAGVAGPFSLGFSDVYAIRNVILKNGSAPTSLTDGTDVTNYFTLNNGQTDTMYDIGFISKSGSLSLKSTDYLLVELDYFSPNYTGRGGFFTVDSYPIQDNPILAKETTIRTQDLPLYVSKGSTSYDLRNYVDFRPVKVITAVDSTDPTAASTNPASKSTSYYKSGTGLKFAVPSSQLSFNYSYYLGRSDIVVVSRDNTINVIPGAPAVNPVVPTPLDNQMMIAVLNIAPFPSLSPYFGNALLRKDLTCSVNKTLIRGWTMKDIGGLDQRIKNLEYYTSLTLLEKDAVNMTVLDANGNVRFKNGIFIDTFKDTTLTAKGTNPDYRIVTDPVELSIRPLFGTDSVPYDVYSLSNAILTPDKLVMFPYTETLQFSQNRVTDFRDLERGTYQFQGQMKLSPEQDVWIDTTQLPDETLSLSADGALLTISDIVGDTLTVSGANTPTIISGANLVFSSANNSSYFTNTTIVITGANTIPGAVVETGYWARGTSSNAIYQVIDAKYLNGILSSIVVQTTSPFAGSFLKNESISIWSTLDFDYPVIGTSRPPYTYNPNPDYTQPAIGFTGITGTADTITNMYDYKINIDDVVTGVSSGASGSVTLINETAGQLLSVEVQGTQAFNKGEQVNFYFASNNAYEKISGTISSVGFSYAKVINAGDIIQGVTSNINGTVVATTYSGSTLVDVSVQVGTTYPLEIINFLRSNNAYMGISAQVTAISAAQPPSQDQTVKYTKNLVNTVWEGWKSTITGYNLFQGSGANKTLVGSYATEAEARGVAANWTTAAGGGVATLEAVYDNSRVGKNYFAQTSSDTAIGPNKLISSQTIPYIRPQVITVSAIGLKPFSQMYVWFDGVNVTKYCTPLTANQYNQSATNIPITPDKDMYVGTSNVVVDITPAGVYNYKDVTTTFITPDPSTGIANSSCPLIVRDTGDLFFRFQIGANTGDPQFRTGSRRLFIMDKSQANVIDITDEPDATTLASQFFFADGTKQTLQRTIYSTKGYTLTSENTAEDYTSETDIVLPNTWSPPPPPKGHCCFDPDAKVLMANQTWKAIKDVMVGDEVIGDNGCVNKVTENKTIAVGSRDMYRFKGSTFWSTDDHLFLTKKGYKTWRPDVVLNDERTLNGTVLIGENREKPFDYDDHLKKYELVDGKLVHSFVSYKDIEPEKGDFDPDYVVHDLSLDGNLTYIVEGFVVHNCCIAYSVLITAPQTEEGIFCTGYDIFVARKSATRKMWFEVREMDSGGQVTNNQIPGSVVYVDNADIPISTNGQDSPVQVKFTSPIFLMNGKEYAFVVHSFSPYYMTVDPDTYLWISRLGEIDKNTGLAVTDRMKTGTFFQTSNNKQWEPIADVDLAINLYRAKFTPGTATVVLGNKPVEKFYLSNVSQSFNGLIGDHFSTGDSITLTGANGTFSVGNIIRGKTTGTIGTVTDVLSENQIKSSNTYFLTSETIDAYSSDGNTYLKISATVSSVANNTAVLTYYDETAINTYAEMASSTGGFKIGDQITDVTSGSTYSAVISGMSDFLYSATSWEPKVLDFLKTDFNYSMATVANNDSILGTFTPIIESETYYWPEEKVIYSRSDELASMNGIPTNQVKVTMTTESEYVTPVLDLTGTHTILIDNIINNDASNEDAKSGGNALNKYISMTVTLADGQDAEDLNVYLTAYRPPGTDVKVYAKMKNGNDPDTFEQKSWIELEKKIGGDTLYSSLINRLNFLEFQFGLPDSAMQGPVGQFQYISNGIAYTDYKYFAIKIVLLSNNSAIVPRVADLRALALQL